MSRYLFPIFSFPYIFSVICSQFFLFEVSIADVGEDAVIKDLKRRMGGGGEIFLY